MAKLTTAEFIAAIKELTVLELNELVKACEALNKHLGGTNALAVSKTDATAPARVIAEFAKKNPKLELVAGVVENGYYDENGIKAIAEVPNREILLGRLLGSMQSPISSFARVLKQIAEKDEAPAAAEEAPVEE